MYSPHKSHSGEILLRGNSITKGYYKRPDLNNDRSIFTEDGWFRTGDIGQFNDDGSLTIIDRVKNLVKLMDGEVSLTIKYYWYILTVRSTSLWSV
jgi:long-subunit acyl-CoA synthetase (AMP-forming)